MSIVRKTAIAACVAAGALTTGAFSAAAGPLPTNIAAVKTAASTDVVQARWGGHGGWGHGGGWGRGGGWGGGRGWGGGWFPGAVVGGLAAGLALGSYGYGYGYPYDYGYGGYGGYYPASYGYGGYYPASYGYYGRPYYAGYSGGYGGYYGRYYGRRYWARPYSGYRRW